MTAAARTCVAAIFATALAVTLAGAVYVVPGHQGSAAREVMPNTARNGYPMVPAALPRGAAAAQVSNITSAGSLNWAGYAVSKASTTFTAVQATFFVPYLDCAQSPGKSLSSAWVGLDGFVGHPESVEQGGIGADCSAAGKASYFAWYEMYPAAEARAAVTVAAGDSVTAAVSYDPADQEFKITLTDNTRGGHFAVRRKCPHVKADGKFITCPRNSAEVITEAPASGSGKHLVIAHLADYGAVSFAAVTVTDAAGASGGIVSSHWTATKIIQLTSSSGATVARPTPTQASMFDNYWLRED